MAADPATRTDQSVASTRSLPDRRFRNGLATITLVGLAVRVAQIILVTGDQALSGDSFYYRSQAQLNIAGHWFIQPYSLVNYGASIPGADHPPGFVILLTALDGIGLKSIGAQLGFLAVLGSATIVVVAWTVRNLFGRQAGLIAATLTALYPNIWVNDGRLMSETMFVFAFSVSLLGVYRFRETRSLRWLIVLAVALTVAASARPEALALFGLIVVPAVIGATVGGWRRRVGYLALAAAIPILILAPWVIYNTSRFDHPVLMSTGAGQTLLQGNCSLTYYGPSIGLNNFECLNQVPVTGSRSLNLAELDARYRHQALRNISKNLSRQSNVFFAREGRTWGLWNSRQQRHIDTRFEHRGSATFVRAQQYSWWLLATLVIPGIVVFRRRRKALYPLLAQIGLTAAATGITFGSTRYRAGAEICLVFLATATIDQLLHWARHRGRTAAPQQPFEEQAPSTEATVH